MISSAPLGQICNVTTGQGSPQDPTAFSEAGIPFIRAGSLGGLLAGKRENQFELINEANAKKFRLKLFPKDTVIFAKSGMSAKIGRVYRLKMPCYLVSHLAAASPAESVDPGYLHRWFEKNPPSQLIENDAYPSIKTSVIKSVKIPLPPLPEQRRIAAILDKADAIRRKRQQAIRLTEEFLRSVFLYMFGDPVNNPKGWEVVKLQNLVNFTTGKLDSNAAIGGGQYPFFTCSRENFQIDKYAFDCEALLLAGNNASADYSVKYYKGKFNAYQRTYVITMARDDLSIRYMQYALEMKLQDMKRLSKGTNTKYLTLGILNELKFQVPDKNSQSRFEAIKEKLAKQCDQHNKALLFTENLFNSLGQRAFRGKL